MAGMATGTDEVAGLRAKLEQLTKENAVLLALVGGTTPTTTLPAPMVVVQGVQVKATMYEYGVLAAVVCMMLLLWAIPMMKPVKRCIESKIYRIYPVITVLNLLALAVTLSVLHFVKFNDLFFMIVSGAEVVIESAQKVLMAFAGLIVLIFLWKFKDRILETLGVDNPTMVIGEFRDWATMWSMKRFYPIEVFIWKVDGLPGVHLHQSNDVFAEISCGYNSVMRTRVHPRAGHACAFKESMQLNFDHFDSETRFNIAVKNQDVMGSSDIASIQLGASQVKRLLDAGGGQELQASQRNLGWGTSGGNTANSAWHEAQAWQAIDLIPAGQIFIRFQPVEDEEKIRGPSYGNIGQTC